MNIRLIIAYILIFLAGYQLNSAEPAAASDNSSLNGYVYDNENGETIIGATVFLEGTKYGAYTNKSGYYSIPGIKPGKYKVIVSSIGYERLTDNISFEKSSPVRKDFRLKVTSVMKESIQVEADREVEKREISISKVNIPVKQLKQIRIGGEADVFRSLQYLPGILTSSQLSSGLFVRGGSPDQNLILVDGATVYNPTHLFGFISTFNPEAIKDVELIKGGFPAEYGGRLSAVLNITQKEGNRNNIEGVASLGAISSRLSLNGPIGNGSWFIGGRRTYFELIKAFLSEDPASPIPDFSFYDLNAKITQDFGDNDKVSLSGFMSKDTLGYSGPGFEAGLSIGNQVASGKWTHIFSDNLFTNVNLSASKYINNFGGDQSGYAFQIENSITDYTLKASLEWFTTETLTHKFGLEATRYSFRLYQNLTGTADSVPQNGSTGIGSTNLDVQDWNYSAYGQINKRYGELFSLQAGIRANYWSISNNLTFDPRLALRYQLQENVSLKASWGIFHQNLRLASQNDFSFFDTWLPTDSTLPASTAYHYVLSLETKPEEGYDLNFDVYYKRLNFISELNTTILNAKVTRDVFFIGDANAYGAELFLQKKFGDLNGWIGYALGFISAKYDSINHGEEFRPKYDRRHDLKIVVNYQLSERWEIGGAFTFQSGQSYTGATSRFQTRLPGSTIGRGIVVPSQRFGLRLPPSHQLNLSGTYSFLMFGLKSKLILDIFNVYNRRDIWFRYYNTKDNETVVEDVRLLPIIPSVSLEVRF